jgi:hypothetical protein
MPELRDKFSTQVDPAILRAVRDLAKKEGRQFQSVVEEAFRDVVEKHNPAKPRPHVLAAHKASMERYAAVYKKLAE